MKNREKGRYSHPFFFSLLIPLAALTFLIAQPVPPASSDATPSPTASSVSDQEQLTKELLKYYQSQNKRSDSSPLNWTAIISVAGALIAAVVALLSLYVNNRTASRNQRDTQFFEALKRFGDKDSPTVRASAAGTIALLGPEPVQRWKRREGKGLPRREEILLYYETAVNQLMTGLLLEENPVTLTAISEAAQKLVRTNPRFVLERVHRANIKLQRDLVVALADFFAAMGIRDSYEPYSKLYPAALVASYGESVIDILMTRYSPQFDSSFGIAVQVLSLSEVDKNISDESQSSDEQAQSQDESSSQTSLITQTQAPQKQGLLSRIRNLITTLIEPKTEAKSEQQNNQSEEAQDAQKNLNAFKEARQRLAIAAERLRANVEVYSTVLKADPFRAAHLVLGDDPDKWDKQKLADMNLEGAFLVEANLHGTNLDGVNLEWSQLQLAELTVANLRRANLENAQLQGAKMYSSNMRGANMSLADLRPFEHKRSDGTTWSTTETNLASSQLQGANLSFSNLESVDLTFAHLEGANLNKAALLSTKLWYARSDDQTTLDEANWWQANYYSHAQEPYFNSLKIWYQKYGDKIPENPNEIHSSVLAFLRAQGQPQQQG